MLTERDPNASGRTSRASNLSAVSRATYRAHGGADKQEHLAPGITSMLRTTMEMGNIGVAGDAYGFGSGPRASQRRGANSRLSMASSMSGTSSHASKHHRQYPSSSAPRRSSAREPSGPQYVADTLSPTVMDLPGSSPLIPTRPRSSRSNMNSRRSYSMTNSTQPTLKLASPRSLSSLRSREPIQRPKSPYAYPARLRRPTHRPASPVPSDMSGGRPRRMHGMSNQGQGQTQPRGYMRRRVPSDPSLVYQDRAPGVAHRSRGGHQPAFLDGQQDDMPLMPLRSLPRSLQEQMRVIHRSVEGSLSSGSTNMRNDSDTPSSDLPSPPTPPDGQSMEGLLSHIGSQFVDNAKDVAVEKVSTHGTLYYDYSEQFEREDILEPEVNGLRTGLVKPVKTNLRELIPQAGTACGSEGPWSPETARSSNTAVPGMVEVPASPVPRRITRDMILQALGPSSIMEDIGDSGDATIVPGVERPSQQETESDQHGQITTESATRIESLNKRFSILSQADSSVVNSSTLEFAVQYSIPIVTGDRLTPHAPLISDKEPPMASDMAPTTEVDMSDLLAGYQHTESKQEEDIDSKRGGNEPVVESVEDRDVETRSSHVQKSSDPDSFKSATDLLEAEPSKDNPEEQHSTEADEKQSSVKEVDAHSFKTAQDMVTPGRSASMPLAKSPTVESTGTPESRPKSEVPLPPIPAVVSSVPIHETSFPLANKFSTKSNQSVQRSLKSISGSLSTLSTSNQPPQVPPRESSTSQEARRSTSVASYLLSRVWGKKLNKDESSIKSRHSSRATLQETRPTNSVVSLQTSPGDAVRVPERALCKESSVSATKPNIVRNRTAPQVHNASVSQRLLQRSSSGPEPVVTECSSVSLPDGGSWKDSVDVLLEGDLSRTHDRRSPNTDKRAANAREPPLAQPASSDDTTTNLRLSQHKYPAGLRNLPDLKEESHEDSSLKPSASQPKTASFPYSFGVIDGVRAPVAVGAPPVRSSSVSLPPKNALSTALNQTRALPSMNFSQMNLLEKMDEIMQLRSSLLRKADHVLQLRSSRSLDDSMVTPPELAEGTPQRPASAGEMREKYRSLCDKLDQLNSPKNAARTEFSDFVLARRARSPQLLAEIDQVTVPSVNGLTERLSELLPSLKEYWKIGDQGPFAAEEMIMEHALEDIHEVGGPVQKRSSARLRPLPGSPDMIVIEDALYTELTNKDKELRAVLAPGDRSVVRGHGESRASAARANGLITQSIPELEAPPPTLLRSRTHTVGDSRLRDTSESGLTRRSLRSVTSTPTDTRPWNFDKSYPWKASTNASVDISLPTPTLFKYSPRLGPSHLRNALSESSTASTFTTQVGSPVGAESDSSSHARQLRPFGLSARNGDQPHLAGERYPTSALAPPTAIFRDNFSASDSSDDDTQQRVVRKGKFNLKKRFSTARNVPPEDNTQLTGSKSFTTPDNTLELAAPEPAHESTHSILQDTVGEARAFTSNRHTFRNAQGMPSVVYHKHKLIDNLKR
ncbi:hypothetical protein E8E13_004137 [Curvularia kusanoi]|uniref:Uncharacterized protein n=1 Tax=Curvularia kusanoi TaxID=90978 RepID=A0A9P4WCH4_CURKU|nr:hypothetical protein E8E13_004137 [Curvularia kusanoi]